MSAEGTVRVDEDGAAVSIVLNRPERGNALDLATAEALRDAVDEVLTAGRCRVIVLRGAGGRFCVGGIDDRREPSGGRRRGGRLLSRE